MDMSSRRPPHKHKEPPDRRLFDLIDGRFMPLKEIGCGAVCLVHLAEDRQAGHRRVAIKRLRGDMLANMNARHSLGTEARALSLVRHMGIPKLIHSQAEGPDPYVAQEFRDGVVFNRNNIHGIRKTVELIIFVLDILDTLHGAGIVHRDVKPSNLILGYDMRSVSLTDFGFSIVPGVQDLAARVDIPVGSPMFMAPEQTYPHARVDRRADIYSVGIMLYTFTSGLYPYLMKPAKNEQEENEEYFRCHRSAASAPLHSLDRRYPATLSLIIERAISKEPGKRFSTAESMADALSDCLANCAYGF